ncbi:unnamed protein product [Cuscuta campestris]|uniref:Uncharacterized protein n=1 Tax=Cuscuta campestris TaxID=132261 RepID=A0A484KK69_9ASTE|nr:unnamed protein product [Cuscuta campestris]
MTRTPSVTCLFLFCCCYDRKKLLSLTIHRHGVYQIDWENRDRNYRNEMMPGLGFGTLAVSNQREDAEATRLGYEVSFSDGER